MKNKVEILSVHCKRCGKSLCTLSRSLYGADKIKGELGNICQDCITPDEKNRIEYGIAEAIICGSRICRK